MAAMFSNTRSGASTNGHIVEFKAGKSSLEPGSSEKMRKVVADTKKGLVFIKQSNDQLIHFCWKDRDTGALVDDLIIFPGDTEFKEVKGCPDGKVFMLKFKSSKEMRLYWLQDGAPEADKDLVKKVNDALNKPPPSRPAARGTSTDRATAGGFPASLADEFGGPLGGLDQNQLLSLIQSLQGNASDSMGIGGSDFSALTSRNEADCEPPVDVSTVSEGNSSNEAAGSGNKGLTTNDLSKILSNLKPGSSAAPKQVNVSLADALSNETVTETAKANADKLQPHLPETGSGPERELAETVRAPQFRQATDTFGNALRTGQLGPVLSQFGLNEATVAAANQGDLRAFARNLTVAEGGEIPTEKESDDSAKEPEPKRNRPDDMDDMDVD